MWQEIQKLLVSLLWPVLKDIVKKILREFSHWMVFNIKEVIQRRKTDNANMAEAKAYEAFEKARTAKTRDEARQHEAVAKVWREVAEMLRQENEALKSELDILQRNSDQKAEIAVTELAFDHAIDSDSGNKKFKAIEGRQLLQLEKHDPK